MALRPAGGATICTASFSYFRYRQTDAFLPDYDAELEPIPSLHTVVNMKERLSLRHPCQLARLLAEA